MIIDCISDLHGNYPLLEGGDLLILAGDLTAHSGEKEIDEFSDWAETLSYKKIVVIGGNHDWYCETFPDTLFGIDNVEYLCDSVTEFEGLKIWGSPWTKAFPRMNPRCKAFTLFNEEELQEKWDLIPEDVDMLVTHSPPNGILDLVKPYNFDEEKNEYAGSVSLRNVVLDGSRMKKLKLHVFGHIHEWGGQMIDTCTTKFVNASHVNERYEPVNTPVRIIL